MEKIVSIKSVEIEEQNWILACFGCGDYIRIEKESLSARFIGIVHKRRHSGRPIFNKG